MCRRIVVMVGLTISLRGRFVARTRQYRCVKIVRADDFSGIRIISYRSFNVFGPVNYRRDLRIGFFSSIKPRERLNKLAGFFFTSTNSVYRSGNISCTQEFSVRVSSGIRCSLVVVPFARRFPSVSTINERAREKRSET